MLRIDRDGNAAEGNEPPEGFDPRIYTYGHRNVQGITFHPDTGQPIVTEHGPWHSDEVNALVNGGNSGWDPRPNMAGRGDCPDDYCGYEPNQGEGMDPKERAAYMPVTDTETYPDAMQPAWGNDGLSQGISSAEFLTGEQWGEWDGRLLVGFWGLALAEHPSGNASTSWILRRMAFRSMTLPKCHHPWGCTFPLDSARAGWRPVYSR
ncbi:hypothetical protein HSBAA_22150 [Vreelandella sulfidaeris]|uniref:Glucose/Sorbosone dehydrogenase domain-containing protein n=1 Tax=Vreelandella sulfidaeris TaxID=115553 RepID=A0A455U7V2_9GAMM|nr:hypothetical protein HSBAA_22150 [Halomonas sulfidaeris]